MRVGRGVGVAVGLMLVSACAPPIQAIRVDPTRAHRVLMNDELTSGEVSRRSQNLLYDHDLTERYLKDPAGALAELHTVLVKGQMFPEDRAALAELTFHYATRGGGRPYFLASALYAWSYLFPDDPHELPDRYSPRLRLACDLYNRGLTEALKDGTNVRLHGGQFALPFGAVDVAFDPQVLRYGPHELTNFVPIGELEVKGLPTYYRWPGLGAPLAAGVAKVDGVDAADIMGRRVRVPVTAFLRVADLGKQWPTGRLRATLELYPGYGEHKVTVAGQEVPLESEPTAAMALTLTDAPIWSREIGGFLHSVGIDDQIRLVALTPYAPGRIPVVFVHGTASSAARWAQMYNELDNDPRLHGRYQFWFFSYETGNPIPYSAMLLRDALTNAMARLDPAGKDGALQQMVVIGHSQGGLLTKSMVVESGDAFWRNVSKKPIADSGFSEHTRELLEHALFFHPLPFVRRVIFVSTPHHGSYVAGSWLAHQAARLVQAPLALTKVVADFATADRDSLTMNASQGFRLPTAVDNMTPGNPFVKTLAGLPIAPAVTAHSIISVTSGVASPTANDGVVAYESAHINGVESELIVKSAHSCQDNPHTVAEVQRILLEHLEAQRR